MHPLNSKFFGPGPGTIKVRVNNGVTTVDGYIGKQISATKWLVTNGVVEHIAKLKGDDNFDVGEFTIHAWALTDGVITGAKEHVIKIDAHHITTSQGNRYIWTLGNPTGTGYAVLGVTT